MRTLNKRDYFYLLVLIILFLIIALYITRGGYFYGSTTDWNQQHWVFPEYFRNLFYETHDFFPSFAFNIGAGQNIYNFSYYGLYSPIILISYFLPFVSMMDYIIISSIILVILSITLFYIWLRKNGFDSFICFIAGTVFLFSAPLIFQSHRQIMFMNYMPFLIMGLIGVDRLLNYKKSLLLITSVTLMILTSYYFSVSGIFAIAVYSVYLIFKNNLKLIDLLKICLPVALGVLLAAFFLMPTFYALISGRTGADNGITVTSLLLPNLNISEFFSSPYSLGTTAISFIALIWSLFSKSKEKIFLSVTIFIIMYFPVFIYFLNGGLYVRPKVLIPFLPLICLITALFFRDYNPEKFKKTNHLISLGLILVISLLGGFGFINLIFITEIIILIFLVLLFYRFKKRAILFIPIAILSFSSSLLINKSDLLISFKEIDMQEISKSINTEDTNLYRTTVDYDSLNNANRIYNNEYYNTTLYSSIYNSSYKDLYFNIFCNEAPYRNVLNNASTKNILFNLYMGNKYLITDKTPQVGYEKLTTYNNLSLYQNQDVFPLGFVTDCIMSENEFNSLNYPYNQEALLNYCVVGDLSQDTFKTTIKCASAENLTINTMKNLSVARNDSIYEIISDENGRMTIDLPDILKNKILFIRFKMNYQSFHDDTYIIINGVKNKLSSTAAPYPNNNFEFEYVISSNEEINDLNIIFNKGTYSISDPEIYYIDYKNLENINHNLDHFIIYNESTIGDKISGYINVTRDGYFVLNIPYDKGFTIKVNGQETLYQKVNKAFIGFETTKGEKEIEITYEAPILKTGITVSLIGIAFTTTYLLFERKRRFLK